ncbi:hypothetical protein BD413DRAFT_442299, partial [Trametes elegans]
CGEFTPGQRMGDFVRHEMTHMPKQNSDRGFRCYGLPSRDPAELAQMYPGLMAARINSGRMRPDVRVLDGVQMVGGCGRTFSRADALRRHLTSQDG